MRGEGEIPLLFFRPIVESLVENHFLCPLQNVLPLQFCQRTEYGQHKAALRGGGAHVLFQTDKLHALSASIERNLIATGLYPNEIGRKKSGTFAPLNKSFKDVIQIVDIISGAVFVVIDGLFDLFKGTSRIVTEIKERTCGSIESF